MRIPVGAALALCFSVAMAAGTKQQENIGCGPPLAKPAAAKPATLQLVCNSNPDNWTPSSTRYGPTRMAEVERGAQAVKAAHPELFEGNKLLGECHASANAFFLALTHELRSKGLCAWPGPDAIHPASTVKGFAEEYHIITYGGCTLWPASRNNYKGDWVIR